MLRVKSLLGYAHRLGYAPFNAGDDPRAIRRPQSRRHAHASHAIDRGATLPEVQATLGHGNIATTSGYLHARPESSSGLKLDPGVFLR